MSRSALNAPAKPIKRVKAGWTDIILVCRKCSKKLDGGFGEDGKLKFSKALRQTVSTTAGRSTGKADKTRQNGLGIIEVDCLDICPKGAVVSMRAGAPGHWLVVPRGTPMTLAARDLGLVPETGSGVPEPVASTTQRPVADPATPR